MDGIFLLYVILVLAGMMCRIDANKGDDVDESQCTNIEKDVRLWT